MNPAHPPAEGTPDGLTPAGCAEAFEADGSLRPDLLRLPAEAIGRPAVLTPENAGAHAFLTADPRTGEVRYGPLHGAART
ncbi:hypothetical protein HDA32_005013 [Spinactinospora alkalitolerans]|uniref:Uncharacterized protein n=1 Tax=Spinactinospora alkalitolerans TaxID=687207 RepID=A0A852U4R5_9ACTN|nr:hypothetical protein [Spinactinospora alkalitolerans]